MSRIAPTRATGESATPGPPRRACLLIVPIVGGVLLLLAALALIIMLGLRSELVSGLLKRDEPSPGMPLEVIKLTPDISTSPLLPPSCETIVSSGDAQVAVSLPISLAVSGKSFPVVATLPEENGLSYAPDQRGAAAWVCGAVVNYVVVLDPSPENEALQANLRPGDEIKLHLSSGVVLFFRFTELREVPANDPAVFEQMRPRMTLILEGENDTWKIAVADYVAETEPVEPPSGTLGQPGTPVRVGDAQVTVVRGYADRSGTNVSPGTMIYLVEFSVQNVGTGPLDASNFYMQLQDGVGNEYLLSPVASAAGEHGLPDDQVAPGDTVQATAGYIVPETLAGPSLTWTFSPSPGTDLRVSVSIPYEATSQPVTAAQAEVSITDAFLNGDGDVLLIEGEVRNIGEGPLTVELSDIRLTSSGGMSELRAAAPPLPWTIQPGETQIIELQYTKPDASAALLALLGYSFEIQGLQ